VRHRPGNIGLTAIVLFFMFADGEKALVWSGNRVEWHGGQRLSAAWQAALTAFSCTARGCLWFGLFSFAVLWGLFYAAGAPQPMAFALAGACASMLPFVAPIMVGYVSAALLTPDNVVGPIALMIIGAGGLGMVNNLWRPKWVGDASGLPMPAALMGMAGGALAWGPAGLLAGPAFIACALRLVEWTELNPNPNPNPNPNEEAQ
jgi:predicted PurR-regulated permease PerM